LRKKENIQKKGKDTSDYFKTLSMNLGKKVSMNLLDRDGKECACENHP